MLRYCFGVRAADGAKRRRPCQGFGNVGWRAASVSANLGMLSRRSPDDLGSLQLGQTQNAL